LTPSLAGFRWNIAMSFGMEKLEWRGYPTVKKIEDMFICFDKMYKRDGRADGRTDGQTDTA